jgi:hypothetical protein
MRLISSAQLLVVVFILVGFVVSSRNSIRAISKTENVSEFDSICLVVDVDLSTAGCQRIDNPLIDFRTAELMALNVHICLTIN